MNTHTSVHRPLAYQNRLGIRNQVARAIWGIVWLLLYRPSPVWLFPWRRALLRLFGATVGNGAHPYPRCRIWAPWNLVMGPGSCLADGVDCYAVDKVTLEQSAIISQQVMLCTATHDYNNDDFRLVTRPIIVGAHAWVGACAFIGPGVSIGEGAVVGAASAVFRDVTAWTVVGGNPARELKKRLRRE